MTNLPTRRRRKDGLPEKPCVTCGRPFAWRRKWATVWDEVRYCSEACRRDRRTRSTQATGPGGKEPVRGA